MSITTLELPTFDVGSLLDDPKEKYYRVDEENIVPIARVITEFVHDTEPDVIVAADRGGRLLALATHASWKHRYPDHDFPTRDGKIHFARISGSIDLGVTQRVIRSTLKKAGLSSDDPEHVQDDELKPKVMLIDDWIGQGRTFRTFADVAHNDFGIPKDNMLMATMHGHELPYDDPTHIIGDPSGYAHGSQWCDDEEIMGVTYYSDQDTGSDDELFGVVGRSNRSQKSIEARQNLHRAVAKYYSRFDKALELGKIPAACNCKQAAEIEAEYFDDDAYWGGETSRWLQVVHSLSKLIIGPDQKTNS